MNSESNSEIDKLLRETFGIRTIWNEEELKLNWDKEVLDYDLSRGERNIYIR
jgi:hypothetical protein